MSGLILLLLSATASTAREYTAEDLASFPKLFHLDDYERCLAKSDGMYCLGTFDLTPAKLPHRNYELMKAYSDESYRHFNRTRIHRGYCVSARCPLYNGDASLRFDRNASLHFERNASLRFERCADRYAQARSFHASLSTLHYCRTQADTITEKFPTTAEHIFTQIIYAIVLINVVGTIYDVYTEDGPNKNILLSAFSIPANWRCLTAVHEGGNPRLTALMPLQGARTVAMFYATYYHAMLLHYTFYTFNPDFLEQLSQRWDCIYLTNGTSLIQGFVVLSCFLTCYNLLIFSKKHELSLHMLPLRIIKRVIRITPVHLLLVGYGATWWVHTRAGPLAPSTIGLESEACKRKLWSHVLFVNNIVDKTSYCVTTSWFLPVDMHMYIVACALTLLLWRRRWSVVKLYAGLFVASCLVIGVISYIKDYKSLIYIRAPEQHRRMFRDSRSFTEFYISSWGALPACFVGLILANIQFDLTERKINLSKYKWFVYFVYISRLLLFTWPFTGMIIRKHTSPLFQAAYIALDRPLYCIIMGVNLLGILHVDDAFRGFLCWRGWHSMSRMSLTVMLLHWCVIMTIGSRPIAFNSSTLDIMVDWISANFITYILAVPITILVEIPMQKFLEALIF